ncbi:MAG: hypothetical protein R2792_01230 [Saprospiraceae bacterium]|jgi:hypothetical protein
MIRITFTLTLFLFSHLVFSQSCVIQKAYKDGKLEWSFDYDDHKRLSEMTQYKPDGAEAMHFYFGYQEQTNWIASIAQTDGTDSWIKTTYERDAKGLVTRMDMFVGTNNSDYQAHRYYEYTNDPNSQFPLQKVMAYKADGTLLEITEIDYFDQNGSSFNTKKNPDGSLIRTEKKVYDNKTGYQRWAPLHYQNTHNLIGIEIRLPDGSIAPQSYGCVMSYNPQGYPIEERTTTTDGTVTVSRYKYECK